MGRRLAVRGRCRRPHVPVQWCAAGRDNLRHLAVDCLAVDSLRTWAGVTQEHLASFPPCLRYYGIIPIGTACTYRALMQLQPRFALDVAAPPTLADMLELHAAKVVSALVFSRLARLRRLSSLPLSSPLPHVSLCFLSRSPQACV